MASVYMTILHETTHYGDYLDGNRQEGEPGDSFEQDVWQTKSVESDGQEYQVQYFFGDKYNTEQMQEIFDEKSKTSDGKKTLPKAHENK